MKRIGTVLMVAAVVAALLAIPLGVAAATGDHDDHPATPGEQLGGVIGAQAAAVDGELDDRTFGQQIANADSDAERADLINERLNETETQIADHQDRIDELRERREAGELSEGRYQAQLARLEAERVNTERTVDRADNTARGLPEDVLADRGISADRIDELRTNARNVGGPETSDAAREIAGENVPTPIAGDRPSSDRGAVDRPGAGDRPDGDSKASDRGASGGEAGDRGATEDHPGSERSTTDRERGVDRGGDQDRDRSERNHENDAGDTDRGQDDSGDSSTDGGQGDDSQDSSSDSNTDGGQGDSSQDSSSDSNTDRGQDSSSDSNTNHGSGGSNSDQQNSP